MRSALQFAVIVIAMIGVRCADAAAPFTFATVEGKQIEGEIVKLSDEGATIRAANGDSPIELDVSDLLSARREGAKASVAVKPPYVTLVDGSLIHLDRFLLADRRAQLELAAGKLDTPIERLKSVQFAARAQPDAEAWRVLDEGKTDGDLLIVIKKDGAAVDYLVGEASRISADEVDFKWDGESIAVKLEKVAAVGFFAGSKPALPNLVATLTLTDGSRLAASNLLLESGLLAVKTASGVELSFPLSDLLDADFSAGKIVYLSDLAPSAVKWSPYVELPSATKELHKSGLPRFDRSFSSSIGQGLQLAWFGSPNNAAASGAELGSGLRSYAKGVAIRSKSELTFRVPDGMHRFVAIAGIDPATRDEGDVDLEIRDDERVIWRGEISGRSAPQEIDVPIGDARRLKIVVDYGRNLDFGDRLHLADARFVK